MKLRAYCEQVAAKWPAVAGKLKVIREMDGMGEVEMDTPPEMETESPDDPVKAAFSSAMHALVDQMDAGEIDSATLLSKLKTLMKAAEKMAGNAEPEPEPVEPADGPDMESVKKQLADVLKENAQLKLAALIGDAPLSEVQRKAVAALSDDADRKALVESFKATGQKPKSGEQNAAKAKQQQTTAGSIPTDGKAFAESLERTK